MNRFRLLLFWLLLAVSGLCCSPVLAAYDLEVPADPWDEYRLQFKTYSKHLLASYDRAFVDDYEGAIREVSLAVELLPDEGIGYAERGKYYRMINDPARAEADFNKAQLLFERALARYRPVVGKKTRKKAAVRKVDPAEAARLIATLHYQRGEAYYSFEKYRQAGDDFKIACHGGNSAACSRLGDVKAIEKRGVDWVPISALQFYDRQRVEYTGTDLVRVWIRREESLPAQLDAGPEKYIQQLELKCSTREFRLLEDPAAPKSGLPVKRKSAVPLFSKSIPGSAPSKMLTLLCPRPPLK